MKRRRMTASSRLCASRRDPLRKAETADCTTLRDKFMDTTKRSFECDAGVAQQSEIGFRAGARLESLADRLDLSSSSLARNAAHLAGTALRR